MGEGPHDPLGTQGVEVILLAGPNRERIRSMVEQAGLESRDVRSVHDVRLTKTRALLIGKPVILTGSIPEVEGILDRSAFEGIRHAAYAADRVIYCGMTETVQVHPRRAGVWTKVRGGLVETYVTGTRESGITKAVNGASQ